MGPVAEKLCSDDATRLGPEHRKLTAVLELAWPLLKSLWEPESVESYFTIMHIIATHYQGWADLLPPEVLLAASAYGQGALRKSEYLQSSALKHFFNPWLSYHIWHITGPLRKDSFTNPPPCCSSDGLSLPAFKEQAEQLRNDTSLSEATAKVDKATYERHAASHRDAATTSRFWTEQHTDLRHRWSILRETADCLLDVAVETLIDEGQEPSEEQKCIICYCTGDAKKHSSMTFSYQMPQEPAQSQAPDKKAEALQASKPWRRRGPDLVRKTLRYTRELRAKLYDVWHAALCRAAGAPELHRAPAVYQTMKKFIGDLDRAAAYLRVQQLAEPDVCGRMVRLTCCKALYCLDCIREEFLFENYCPHCRHLFRLESLPAGSVARPMMRFADGSWRHSRVRLSMSFLAGVRKVEPASLVA